MINITLFVIAVVLFVILLPFALLYAMLDTVSQILGEVAISIDMAGNVLLAPVLNNVAIQKGGYRFGRRKETISSVLGKNKVAKTLSRFGNGIATLLDYIDKNHCIKSIDYNV